MSLENPIFDFKYRYCIIDICNQIIDNYQYRFKIYRYLNIDISKILPFFAIFSNFIDFSVEFLILKIKYLQKYQKMFIWKFIFKKNWKQNKKENFPSCLFKIYRISIMLNIIDNIDYRCFLNIDIISIILVRYIDISLYR